MHRPAAVHIAQQHGTAAPANRTESASGPGQGQLGIDPCGGHHRSLTFVALFNDPSMSVLLLYGPPSLINVVSDALDRIKFMHTDCHRQ